jgi:hypothetical protein
VCDEFVPAEYVCVSGGDVYYVDVSEGFGCVEGTDEPRIMASIADFRSSIGLYSFVERGTIRGNLEADQRVCT